MYIINTYDKIGDSEYSVWWQTDRPINKDLIKSLYPDYIDIDCIIGYYDSKEWIDRYLVIIEDKDIIAWVESTGGSLPICAKKIKSFIYKKKEL